MSNFEFIILIKLAKIAAVFLLILLIIYSIEKGSYNLRFLTILGNLCLLVSNIGRYIPTIAIAISIREKETARDRRGCSRKKKIA